MAVQLSDNRLIVVDGADRDAMLKASYGLELPDTMKGKPAREFAPLLQAGSAEIRAWDALVRIKEDVATLALNLLAYQRQVALSGLTADNRAPVDVTLPPYKRKN